jgi:glycosyltransferase involved in cell wall biosynthesis
MKVAYVYTALVTVGGTDRVVIDKANYLADVLGYDVVIVTDTQLGRPPVFPLSPKVRLHDLAVDFSQEYGHSLPVRVWWYWRLMRRYKRLLRQTLDQQKPDVVISTMGREMDIITSMKQPGRVVMGEVHLAKPFMRGLHLMRARGGIYRLLAVWMMRRQERHASQLDRLVVLTHQDARSWEGIVPTTVIPNFYPFYPKQLDEPKSGKTVIAVGRYSEQKGYDLLIAAWHLVNRRHPDWQLNIFGNGLIRHEYDQLLDGYGLHEVVHLNPPSMDIEREYQRSEFYVLSSRYEGFGMVLVEAMTCGLPCVSFDCPHGPSDIVTHGEDGLMVEPGNVEKLADAICWMIEHPEERKDMGRKARQNVKRYAPECVMKQWDALFNELTSKQP